MRSRPAAAALMTTVLVAAASPAQAISSDNSFPAPERTEVGALVAQWDSDRDPATPDRVDWVCSGTMISVDVFLTAAHCVTDWPEGVRLGVSLEEDVEGALQVERSDGLEGDALFDAVAVEGTPHWAPGYPGTGADSRDIGVLELDPEEAADLASRSEEFEPATLPTEGQLSELGSRALDAATWTVVGYGTHEAQRGPGGHTFPGGGERRQAELDFNALTKTWVRLSMIEARGLGGACYGDSGGPNFVELDGELVLASITVTGDVPCYATNDTYRTDTRQARTFLEGFVDLPER